MADKNPRKQVIEHLKEVENVLVTVNTDPTVDELSAALGLTLMLNKAGKHATSIFSGAIPPAITFLEPKKTFENTVNSLRDFIIALDKEKADHLRYKVDGDMVKIFITPYKTTISDQDLEFSQGDYNVEMVVAIGVRSEDDLDRALTDHGKIMHDATVASISVGSDSSELGTINWHDSDASSYSELLVGIAEELREDKTLLDEQIATAYLTGIVAATERFSNKQTTSNAMTMAAQLMAAGANQQLIATQLEEADELPKQAGAQPSAEKKDKSKGDEEVSDRQRADGTMQISHEKKGSLEEVSDEVERDNQSAAAQRAAKALDEATDNDAALAAKLSAAPSLQNKSPSIDDLKRDLEAERAQNKVQAKASGPESLPEIPMPAQPQFEPMMGGTLNATTDLAADEKRREEMSDRNKTTLSHDHGSGYMPGPPPDAPALNSFSDDDGNEPSVGSVFDTPSPVTPSTHGPTLTPPSQFSQPAQPTPPAPAPEPPQQPPEESLPPMPSSPFGQPPQMVQPNAASGPTLADLDAQHRMTPHDEARADIEAALARGTKQPSVDQELDAALPPADPMTTLPPAPLAAQPPLQGTEEPLPPLPPMPDFSTLPPLPGQTASTSQPSADTNAALDGLVQTQPPAAPPQNPNDPAQFQIPPQQ